MRIITRYVAREFTLNFLLGLGAFSATYLIVEFFERINAFVYNKAPWPLIGAYFLNKFPLMLFQVAPAAVLLASILTLGIMSRHNEVMAMKSGGVGLWSLTHPILGVVGMIFVVLLGMNEYVVPYANQNARMITNLVIHKKKATETFKQSQIWIHGQQTIYNVQLYHPERNLLEGITLYRFSPRFELLERVDARSAQWQDGQWVLTDASVTDFAQQGVAVRKNYPQLTLSLSETPLDFQVAEKNPNEMNYRELKEYVRKIERDGYNASKYRTAMYACISFPFISVIMAFLGIPLALRKERGAGLALGIGYSIIFSFTYLVVYSFILELGKAGSLPPMAAAWLGNIIFGMIGTYLLLSVKH
jgi:lipopolysaccharide export system permease protein